MVVTWRTCFSWRYCVLVVRFCFHCNRLKVYFTCIVLPCKFWLNSLQFTVHRTHYWIVSLQLPKWQQRLWEHRCDIIVYLVYLKSLQWSTQLPYGAYPTTEVFPAIPRLQRMWLYHFLPSIYHHMFAAYFHARVRKIKRRRPFC